MRALALLGLLTTACGLEMGGLGGEPDNQSTADATSMDEAVQVAVADATQRDESLTVLKSDSSAIHEGGSAPSSGDEGDGGAVMDDAGAAIHLADGGSDSDATVRPGDGGPRDTGSGDTGSGDTILSERESVGDDASSAGDAATVDEGTPCASAIPSGWTLELYNLGPGTCPADFTEHEAFGPPTVGAAACSCPCSVTLDGDCAVGTMTVYGTQDNVLSCTTALFSLDVSGSACLSVPPNAAAVQVPARTQASPLPAQGGACTGDSQVDPTQVLTSAAHYCDVPGARAESICNGTVPSGFAACIATNGTTSCASGTPFVHRYVVEDSVALKCSACTACTVATTCSNATIAAYDNRQCRNPIVASIQVDGACDPSEGAGTFPTDALAVKYTATALTTCIQGQSKAGVQLVNPRTICCL